MHIANYDISNIIIILSIVDKLLNLIKQHTKIICIQIRKHSRGQEGKEEWEGRGTDWAVICEMSAWKCQRK